MAPTAAALPCESGGHALSRDAALTLVLRREWGAPRENFRLAESRGSGAKGAKEKPGQRKEARPLVHTEKHRRADAGLRREAGSPVLGGRGPRPSS